MSTANSTRSRDSGAEEKQSPEDGLRPANVIQLNDLKQQTRPSEAVKTDTISGAKLWIVMSSLTLALFLILLDISILATATPKITSDFHSLVDVGWYGAAYQLASGCLQPLTGKVYASFRSKWTFFAFFLTFELGSLLCATAVSSNMLIVGRAVAGIGAAGIQSGTLTIIAGAVPMRKRPALLGIMIGVAQLGLVAGPLFGGLLTEYVTWRWCFYINLPIGGVAAAVLAVLHIPEQVSKPPPMAVLRDIHNKLDLLGFALFAPAVIMILLAIQWGGNKYPWNSSIVIGVLCGGFAALLVWLIWDYYKKEKGLIPVPVLKKTRVWSSTLYYGFFSSAMFLTSYYLPIYFQAVRGKTPTISGIYLLPGILGQVFGAILSGQMINRLGYYLPWAVASSVLTAIGYGMLSTFGPHTITGEWVGYQLIFGFGRGFGMQASLVAVQSTLAPAEIPIAMSLLVFGQTFCGALFLSFADTIFTNELRFLLKRDAPGVDAQSVINAGAYTFRTVVPSSELAGVLMAYALTIDRVFYVCAALAGICFALSWLLGWTDIRKDRDEKTKS